MTLTLADRCDTGDGAAAQTRWTNESGSTLDFCGHHARAKGPEMLAQGFRISDSPADVTAAALAGVAS